MNDPSPAEVRNVSAALVNAAQDLDQIMASLPPNVEPATVAQLKELAEHLQDLAALLQPTA
ncbi:MAG TPA: hypothetical protein PK018_00180 [Candidatus Competibacter sp.]|nr:hypothetical protein [Candidatus Competibacteraceae bacterium]HPE70581.1 hypothetical protein [Candidatus Competibacter sp.]HRX70590.1 hypothetical protein [Candidatus Competibacteraceae bacterium]